MHTQHAWERNCTARPHVTLHQPRYPSRKQRCRRLIGLEMTQETSTQHALDALVHLGPSPKHLGLDLILESAPHQEIVSEAVLGQWLRDGRRRRCRLSNVAQACLGNPWLQSRRANATLTSRLFRTLPKTESHPGFANPQTVGRLPRLVQDPDRDAARVEQPHATTLTRPQSLHSLMGNGPTQPFRPCRSHNL